MYGDPSFDAAAAAAAYMEMEGLCQHVGISALVGSSCSRAWEERWVLLKREG
jgi:hypothetical protein